MRIKVAFILLLCTLKIYGQEFYFKNIGTAQGLPSSETYHSLQDSKGFIWITTDAGVCRYDGNSITTFTTKDGLPENVVFNVYEDHRGRIWFNSISGNFFYFENGVFQTIAANSELASLATVGINGFFVGEKDTLFISLANKSGIFKIASSENYKNIIHQNVNRCQYFIYNNKSTSNEIIIGASNKIKLKQTSDTIYNFFNSTYLILLKESYSNLYKGCVDNRNIIYLPNKNQLTVIRPGSIDIDFYDFMTEIVFVKQDKNGDLWVGTKSGGYYYRKSNLKSTPIHFLKGLVVSDIMIDRENNSWICTLQKGLFKSININLLDVFTEDDNVCNFTKGNGALYVAFASRKIIEVKNNSISTTNVGVKNPIEAGSLSYVFKSGLSTYYGNTSDLFYNNGTKTSLISDSKSNGNGNILVRKIISLGSDSIAVVGFKNIYLVNKNNKLQPINSPFIIKSIIQLRDKRLLVGSRSKEGIYQLRNNEFIQYLSNYPQLKTRINDMQEDANGYLWIATNEKGLFCYAKSKLYVFSQTKSLNSNKVNELSIDDLGNVWVATNSGLNKLVLSKGIDNATVESFNTSHGLPNLEIEHITVYNNNVWCSTKEHLFYFECNKMTSNYIKPFTFIKSITLNDTALLNVNSFPTLKYNQNNIAFEFTGITFKNNDKKEFIYRLNGYETDWKTSTTGQNQYTNLPHGNYTLEVYVLNNDKIKSAKPALFKFTILKPFWLTWWFILGEIILLISIVYLIIYWSVSKIKKREEEKTLVSQKLAEFQMTAVRAQMNPHFVFNAISSIQHYILSNDKYNSYDYLAKFSHLIRNVLDNSQHEYLTLEKEIITLSLYIELEKIRFKVPFEFVLTIDDEIEQNDVYVPTMLIQPYIENAIWHGLMPKQADCLLELTITQSETNLLITVRDNGIGRGTQKTKEKKHESMAMGLTEQRIKALSVKNNAEFTVEVNDLKDKNGNPWGTEVKISMPILND